MSSRIFRKFGFRALSIVNGLLVLKTKGLLYVFLEKIKIIINKIMNDVTLIMKEAKNSPSVKAL